MREREEPVTQTVKATEARQQWSRLLNQVCRKERRVLVEKDGIPVAAIVSTDDLKQLQRYEQERARRFAILAELREPFKDTPPEEIEREVSRAIAEVRAEGRRAAHKLA